MAFLSGSWVTDRACKESDIDIAVYFKPKTGRPGWEDFDVRYEEFASGIYERLKGFSHQEKNYEGKGIYYPKKRGP